MIGRNGLLATMVLASLAVPAAPAIAATPIVIGHRGASAYRPEHTLAAYALAIDQGADFVEPDLVATKDGVLVARHENYIGGDSSSFAGADSTDVASRPEFAGRKTSKLIDGVLLTGWFTEDFTLAELKTLRANERIPGNRPGNTAYNGLFEVPTLQEVIDLVKAKEAETGRRIGIYPETKHPSYFDSIGLSLEEPLVATLVANGYTGPDDLVFVQSFEVANLIELNSVTDVNLVQLFGSSGRPYDFVLSGDPRTYSDLATAAGLLGIALYADGVGPDKGRIIPRNADGTLGTPTTLVADAHLADLLVHPYTFRPENPFLPTDLRIGSAIDQYGNDGAELAAFFATGIDGLFADAPDRAYAARTEYLATVPEPASWAMLIGGFGMVGVALRKGRRTARVAS
jgi:glycerophosphoryl diester phosphodiesterase